MVKSRSDAKKNKAKIVKAKVKNPLASQREIAKETNLSKTAVQEHLKELPKATKDDRIEGILNVDLECVKLGTLEIKRRLQDDEELKKMRAVEISQVIKENTARYTLFRGNATDEQGGLKSIEDFRQASDDELLASLQNE